MRVSIVNVNLVAADAIGRCVLNQVRFFQRRGDDVLVYCGHPPVGVSDQLAALVKVATLAELIAGDHEHFARSDLYVYHYPSRYPLIETIKGIERGVVVFYYHNVTPPDLWDSAFEREHLQHSIDSVRMLASCADLVVTPSPFNLEQLVQEHACEADRIRVLHYAVDLDTFKPGLKDPSLLERYGLDGKRVMLYVGRMAGNKRIDLLVEALAIVRREFPNTVLMLVGDTEGNPAIQEHFQRARDRAQQLELSDAVIFTGTMQVMPPYYRLADVYVSASMHEGFGVPLVEAMASGVPVVASRATAHPWVLGDAGLLCEPGVPDDLAARTIELLRDSALYGDLVRRGLKRARDFSLQRYESGWAQIVADVSEWLPPQPYPRARSISAQGTLNVPDASSPTVLDTYLNNARLHDELERLKATADVMLRGYSVHSKLPLLGRLIAWTRRNLTSHLREPYLDVMFERQVAFNRQVLALVQELADLTVRPAPPPKTENTQLSNERAGLLATRLDLLSLQLTGLFTHLNTAKEDPNRSLSVSSQLVQLQAQLDALQQTISGCKK